MKIIVNLFIFEIFSPGKLMCLSPKNYSFYEYFTNIDFFNDFSRTHLQDLIETTAQIHYEAFRSKQLLALKESSTKQHEQQQQQQSQPVQPQVGPGGPVI